MFGSLEGEQAHLWSVPMGEHDLVAVHDARQLTGCAADVGELIRRSQRFAPAKQRVSAQGDNDSHWGFSLQFNRASRRVRP
jgi:hypothetical protein